jgi:hypothetical protein
MRQIISTLFLVLIVTGLKAQMAVFRDTLPVYESGTKLLSPWAGGLNYSSFSQIDLNFDGKNDIVAFDKVCNSGGKLRAFLNIGSPGVAKYKHSPEYQDKLPSLIEWALFFDYDSDGKSDIFTYTTGGIKVFKNTSTASTVSFSLTSALLVSDYNPTGTPNVSNIPCNPVGLPGIGDIDGDGDLDILTYSVFGIKIEYHKNMSMELYGNANSLVFKMVDDCWGDMQENSCQVYLSTCPYPKLYNNLINGNANKIAHSGSCIMCIDNDGDGDKDLVLGDVSCTTVEYVDNVGSASNAHIGDTTKLYPNYPSKGNTTVIKMNSFPCTYNLDVDNDGKKDLLASPNIVAGAENYQSVWYYKNTSSTPSVNFVIQKKNFLQEDMIEVGEGAYPVLFDADADGKKDLIVGNLGYYSVNTNISRLAYYRNIGTNTAPSFSLITKDYQGLSSYNLYSMAPTFGDLDNDGDQDLIIGSTNGRVHYFQNLAGIGNPAVFGNYQSNYQNILGSNFVYPQLFDVDKNGTLDLLLGSQNGRISYWRNIGNVALPTFTSQSTFLGGVDVKPYGYSSGYAMPYMYNDAGVTKLMVGSESGNLYLYDNIDGNVLGTYNRVDTTLFKLNEGTRAAPCFEDITNDGKRDLVLGNQAGGLAFFNSTNIYGVGINELHDNSNVSVYPNPCNEKLTVSINDNTYEEHTLKLIDVLGKEVYSANTYNKTIEVNCSNFSKGIYVIILSSKSDNYHQVITKKIIIN